MCEMQMKTGATTNQDRGEVLGEEEYQHHHPLVLDEVLKIHHEIGDRQAHEGL